MISLLDSNISPYVWFNTDSWRYRNMISSDLSVPAVLKIHRNMISFDVFSPDLLFGHASSWMFSFVNCQWYDTPLFICLSKQVRRRADLGGFLTFRFLVDFSHSDFRGFLIVCGNATPLCLSVWLAGSFYRKPASRFTSTNLLSRSYQSHKNTAL